MFLIISNISFLISNGCMTYNGVYSIYTMGGYTMTWIVKLVDIDDEDAYMTVFTDRTKLETFVKKCRELITVL